MYETTGLPMSAIAGYLERVANRPVVDRTGLTGQFNVTLRFNPNLGGLPDPAANASLAELEERPSIFTAVREQWGLKLEPATAPLDVLVIDAATQPAPD